MLSYDKDYAFLKPQRNEPRPRFSGNGGLWLLSQYFKNVIPPSVVAAPGPLIHFEQCLADGGV